MSIEPRNGKPPADGSSLQSGVAQPAGISLVSPEMLADQLLKLSRRQQGWAIEFDQPELRQLPIAQALMRRAEAALEDRPIESAKAADLAAAIAGGLDSDEDFQVRLTGAMASWLLGTAILNSLSSADTRAAEDEAPKASAPKDPKFRKAKSDAEEAVVNWKRLKKAAVAFSQILTFQTLERLWERALASAGLAKVSWLQGKHLQASALFATSTRLFARVTAREPLAACHILHGFLQLGIGDHRFAQVELANAERLLDTNDAPTLAMLLSIGLASCAATGGRLCDAEALIAKARALRQLVSPVASVIPTAWQEILQWNQQPQAEAREQPTLSDAAHLSDPVSLVLLAGSPWQTAYPGELATLADRLLLGRREDRTLIGDQC